MLQSLPDWVRKIVDGREIQEETRILPQIHASGLSLQEMPKVPRCLRTRIEARLIVARIRMRRNFEEMVYEGYGPIWCRS